MGIHVGLYIQSRRISEARWLAVFEETLQWLVAWPDRPIRLTSCEIAGERVAAYSTRVEDENGWRVSGDARSRTHFESFDLPRRLAHEHGAEGADPSEVDILHSIAAFDSEPAPGEPGADCQLLLGGKTQGLPYHHLMVAVATLIENRLPGAAAASGDIDAHDARRACRELERVFGGRFEPPVLLDEARVRSRAPEFSVARLRDHVGAEAVNPVLHDLFGVLSSTPRYRASKEIREVAPGCTDIAGLHPHTLECMDAFGAKLRRVSLRAELGAKRTSGALSRANVLRQLVSLTRARGLNLTELAWREIENEEAPALAFLHDLCHIDLRSLQVHEMAVAAFESPAVRRRIMQAWDARE